MKVCRTACVPRSGLNCLAWNAIVAHTAPIIVNDLRRVLVHVVSWGCLSSFLVWLFVFDCWAIQNQKQNKNKNNTNEMKPLTKHHKLNWTFRARFRRTGGCAEARLASGSCASCWRRTPTTRRRWATRRACRTWPACCCCSWARATTRFLRFSRSWSSTCAARLTPSSRAWWPTASSLTRCWRAAHQHWLRIWHATAFRRCSTSRRGSWRSSRTLPCRGPPCFASGTSLRSRARFDVVLIFHFSFFLKKSWASIKSSFWFCVARLVSLCTCSVAMHGRQTACCQWSGKDLAHSVESCAKCRRIDSPCWSSSKRCWTSIPNRWISCRIQSSNSSSFSFLPFYFAI